MDVASLPPEVAAQTIEHQGATIPIYEHPAIKNTPDMPTAFRRLTEMDAEINRRVRIPAADAKPEDVQGFWKRVSEGKVPVDSSFLRTAAGVPATPAEYEYAKPEKLPDGMTWDDNRLNAAKEWAHKAGLNKEQFKSALDLYQQIRTEELNVFKGDPAASMEALKKEWGADFEQKWALANAGADKFFDGDQELMGLLKATGLALTPKFAAKMAEYGAATGEDHTVGSAAQNTGPIQAQIDEIMKPGGAKFDAFMKGDPAVLAERDRLYAILKPGMVGLT